MANPLAILNVPDVARHRNDVFYGDNNNKAAKESWNKGGFEGVVGSGVNWLGYGVQRLGVQVFDHSKDVGQQVDNLVTEINASTTAIKSNFTAVKTNFDNLQSRVTAINNNLETAVGKIDNLVEKTKDYEDLVVKTKDHEDALNILYTFHTKRSQEITDARGDITRLTEKLNGLNNEKAVDSSKIERAKEAIAENKQALDRYEKRLQEVVEKVKELSTIVYQNDNKLKEHGRQLEERKRNEAALFNQTQELRRGQQRTDERLDIHAKRADALRTITDLQGKKLEELDEGYYHQRSLVRMYGERLNSHTSRMDSLEQRSDGLGDRVDTQEQLLKQGAIELDRMRRDAQETKLMALLTMAKVADVRRDMMFLAALQAENRGEQNALQSTHSVILQNQFLMNQQHGALTQYMSIVGERVGLPPISTLTSPDSTPAITSSQQHPIPCAALPHSVTHYKQTPEETAPTAATTATPEEPKDKLKDEDFVAIVNRDSKEEKNKEQPSNAQAAIERPRTPSPQRVIAPNLAASISSSPAIGIQQEEAAAAQERTNANQPAGNSWYSRLFGR